MRVTVVGQPAWTRDVARGIGELPGVHAVSVPFDSSLSLLGLLRVRAFRTSDLIVRVGFRPGANTMRGRIFDALFRLVRLGARGRVAYFWIGTDAANAVAQVTSGQSVKRFKSLAANATHVADSFDVAAELHSIGVDATVAWMPARERFGGRGLPEFPECFTVLSYMPDFRPEFYGASVLLEVAKRLPDVRFLITSTLGRWAVDAPANVTFLGRQPNMVPVFEDSTCLVRTVQHDGLSVMVLEALSYGRKVIYTAACPHTTRVPFGDVDALESVLRSLALRWRAGDLPLDIEAADWARRASDPADCWPLLLRALGGGPGRTWPSD